MRILIFLQPVIVIISVEENKSIINSTSESVIDYLKIAQHNHFENNRISATHHFINPTIFP